MSILGDPRTEVFEVTISIAQRHGKREGQMELCLLEIARREREVDGADLYPRGEIDADAQQVPRSRGKR
jgi:hypothetical protein